MHTAQNHISNDSRYSKLNTLYKSLKNKGPTYIGGDFNARLQGKEDQGETNRLIGNHLFNPKSLREHLHESMQENKNKLIEFVSEHKLILANTWFQKGDNKLATHKAPDTTPQSPLKRPYYDTIDYWLVPQRWKNSITNCGSDMAANVKSDHFPLTIT